MRLANLRSGQFDVIERVAPSDIEGLKKDKNLKVARITEIGYQGITINVGKSEQAQKNPLGKDAKVREAFELSLDRAGIVQVVMDNEATVGNQWVAPSNAFYAKNVPVPKRDVARAKALLKEAGVPNPSFTLVTPTTSDAQRIALVVQAMTREAGFDVKIQSTEFATSLNMADKGDFEAYVLAWSGRADPDGNLYSFDACKQPLNYAGYCIAGDRRAAQRLAQPARPRRAQEDLRADRRARAQGPADHLPLPPQLAVGAQREAERAAQHSGRAAAGDRFEDDAVKAPVRQPSTQRRGRAAFSASTAAVRPAAGLPCGARSRGLRHNSLRSTSTRGARAHAALQHRDSRAACFDAQ